MSSLLNGRQSGKTTKGRTLESGFSAPAKSGVSRLDLQEMIEDALDDLHAHHKPEQCWCSTKVPSLDFQELINDTLDELHSRHEPGQCWCANEIATRPVNRASERRLRFKESRKPSPPPEYQVMQVERQQ